jgi:predicted MFS family arabinose efflux permease
MGMALGGWLGGAVFDATASYSDAFLTGAGFNLVNFLLIGALFIRRHCHGAMPQVA